MSSSTTYVSGVVFRSVSHTCDCYLELPIDYSSYEDFLNGFKPILLDTKLSSLCVPVNTPVTNYNKTLVSIVENY